MGLFSRDLKYNETEVTNGITALNQTKDKVKDTLSNIKAQLDIINGARGFEIFKPLSITPFEEEHDNCTSYVDQLVNSITEMKTSIEEYNNSSAWDKACHQ